MRIEYEGHAINIGTTQEDNNGLWTAEIWIWPLGGSPCELLDIGHVGGSVSQEEAEEAGRRWGESRIDKRLVGDGAPKEVGQGKRQL